MMTIAQIMEKMIAFSEGNIHDITHLSCVWTYAKTIGELEGLDADTQLFWRWRPSPTISPARSAAKSTATPMVNIRSRRVPRWCGSSWRIPA